jgi:hypothetical protein
MTGLPGRSEQRKDVRRAIPLSGHYADIFDSSVGKRTGAAGRQEIAASASSMRRRRMLRSLPAASLSKPRCEYSSITSKAYRSSVTRSGFGVVYIMARLYSQSSTVLYRFSRASPSGSEGFRRFPKNWKIIFPSFSCHFGRSAYEEFLAIPKCLMDTPVSAG